MAPIPQGGTVAVTGSAGFIGGWVVRQLLDEGYRVRACVRDISDEDKTSFLKAMPGYASGRLTLHSADLDEAGCFDEIFRGCHGVAHLSHVSSYDDMDYVKKVCDHVINSVNLSQTVNRVVVTSSIAAVISESDMQELVRRPVLYEDRYPDEQNPKRQATVVRAIQWARCSLNVPSLMLPRKVGAGTLSPVVPVTTLALSSQRTKRTLGRGNTILRQCFLASTRRT